MSTKDAEALAREGVTGVVVSPAVAEPAAWLGEIADFAERFALAPIR